MINKNATISVIIPVYNVYDWIDQCLESIINQSFKDFEVILVDDGSTDNSDKKCEKWEQMDQRVRVIKQQNAGPSAARNKGIKAAQGEYISFIDADDWIDKDFLQELYNAAEESNSDIAECDIWKYNDKTGTKVYYACYGCMGKSYTKEEHMLYGHTAIWKCLFRRKLFIDNDVWFPDCYSEARAVYALLIALSNNIVNVRRPLYYYRKFRKNSLSAKPREVNESLTSVGVQAFKELLNGFKHHGIYEEYEKLLIRIVNYKLSDILCGMFTKREINEFNQTVDIYRRFILQQFPDINIWKYFVLGGYNLSKITWLMNMLHIPSLRFNFSGLISIMNPVRNQEVSCANRYRHIMVNRDIQSEFWQILIEEKPQYLIMDFIEERYDVVEFDGGYLTKSDAFDECNIVLENARTIGRETKEYQQLWKQSCCDFIEKIKECQPKIKVILVKNYLSEYVGNIYHQESYLNQEWIQKTNNIIRSYYDFFEEKCDFAEVIEASSFKYYYTDEEFEHGAEPSHLNNIVNKEIALKVENIMNY